MAQDVKPLEIDVTPAQFENLKSIVFGAVLFNAVEGKTDFIDVLQEAINKVKQVHAT